MRSFLWLGRRSFISPVPFWRVRNGGSILLIGRVGLVMMCYSLWTHSFLIKYIRNHFSLNYSALAPFNFS